MSWFNPLLPLLTWFLIHSGSCKNLYFAGFFPMNQEIGQGVLPAVNLAISHINESPKILHKHRLHMVYNDTQCNPGVGLKSFFDIVHHRPKKLYLFGSACSAVTDQITKAAKHWNMVQLSYGDTHPMFTEKSYPNFFRIVPSENEYNQPRLSLMRYFNWTRVGTLYQNEAKYTLAHNNLISELEKNGFEVVVSQSFNDELQNQMEIFKKKDVRIFLGNFDEFWARKVLCKAFHENMYGARFQWILVGFYEVEWWLKPTPNCSRENMKEAVQGIFSIELLTLATNSITTKAGITPEDYQNQYLNQTTVVSNFHAYAYDGVWALAIAMDSLYQEVQKRGENLQDFEYRNKTWEQDLITALDKAVFHGMTGPVSFRKNSRRASFVIKQIQDQDSKCIGEYSGITRTLHLERCDQVFWPRNKAPKDRTFIKTEQMKLSWTIFLIFVMVAGVGILLAFFFLVFNITHRNQKQIKMSSPNMNNLIIIGCILSYSSVILLGLDSNLTSNFLFPYVCTGRAWILMSGFTLSFGSMFSKTWRVHSIFTNVQLNKKVMQDYQLYLVVGALIFVDVLTLTAWQILDPFYRETRQLQPIVSADDELVIIPILEYCRSKHMTAFVGCIYVYKGLLILFGAFLAWETRQVQIPALNDSKYVGMSVYNVTIMCVLGVAVSFVLGEEHTMSFVIISIFIIFCTTGTLCLVFVPKIIEVRKEPAKRELKNGKTTMKMAGVAKTKEKTDNFEELLRIAKKVNFKLKGSIADIDKDIEETKQLIAKLEAEQALAAEQPPEPSVCVPEKNLTPPPAFVPEDSHKEDLLIQPPVRPNHIDIPNSLSSVPDLPQNTDDILPIFQKLLEDKHVKGNFSSRLVTSSCPNISVTCDIIEYL